MRRAALALALAACSPLAEPGALWPHREQIVQAFQLRTGPLAGSGRKLVRACHRYWSSGDASEAELAKGACDRGAAHLARRLAAYTGANATSRDMRDPALWRYVAKRASL